MRSGNTDEKAAHISGGGKENSRGLMFDSKLHCSHLHARPEKSISELVREDANCLDGMVTRQPPPRADEVGTPSPRTTTIPNFINYPS